MLVLGLALGVSAVYMASPHFSSLCCHARRMLLNGYLRSDQHVWCPFEVRPVPVQMLMPAPAHFFLPVSVLMLTRVPVPFCRRACGFGATYILALVGFQDPVSGAACACLRPRFRDFREQTAWPLCTSVRSAVVLEGCHSMVTFAVTNTCGVYSRGSGTDYMASLHFSSLCCRARRMLLNVTHACGVCLRGSGDRLHGLSALRLALLSWLPSHN